MEPRYDIRFDKTFMNANNDVEWFNSDVKHIKDTITTTPGSYKENPADGVAVNNFLLSSGQEAEVAQKVIFELNKDFYKCNTPIINYDSNGRLKIDPNL
jgi:hypothetical protein